MKESQLQKPRKDKATTMIKIQEIWMIKFLEVWFLQMEQRSQLLIKKEEWQQIDTNRE
jgi:hypothetical protein